MASVPSTGLTTTSTVQWTLDTLGGTPDYQDNLGRGLAAGDFDGDGRGEMVIGMPGGDAGAVFNPGRIYEVHTDDTPALYDWSRVFLQEDIATVSSEDADEMGHSFAPTRSRPLECTPVIGGPGGWTF